MRTPEHPELSARRTSQCPSAVGRQQRCPGAVHGRRPRGDVGARPQRSGEDGPRSPGRVGDDVHSLELTWKWRMALGRPWKSTTNRWCHPRNHVSFRECKSLLRCRFQILGALVFQIGTCRMLFVGQRWEGRRPHLPRRGREVTAELVLPPSTPPHLHQRHRRHQVHLQRLLR